MVLRNSNGIEFGKVYFTTVQKLSFETFHQKWKNASSVDCSIHVLPNQVSKKSFYRFEAIDLRESHAKLHRKRRETLGADSI